MHRLIAVSIALFAVPALADNKPAAAEPEWAVEGQWVDTCTCAIPCPCWNEKPTPPTHKDCPDVQYFHVTKGHYGATSLDGLDVVQVAISADNQPFDESLEKGTMKLNNLYLPKSASPAVAEAAEKVFGHLSFAPLASSKKHAVKHVDIKATTAGDKTTIVIPSVLDAEVVQLKDKKGQPEKFAKDVTVIPYFSPATQGKSLKYKFSDDGYKVDVKGRNVTFTHFAYDSKRGPLPWEPGYKPPAAPKK